MGFTFLKVLPMSPNRCNLCPKTKYLRRRGDAFSKFLYRTLVSYI